jgi:transcriptional regulator with XRE-family HTH domain
MLREARRRAGLSQRQLSRFTGVAESRISDYETGRHQPSAAILQRLLAGADHDLVAVPRPPRVTGLAPARNGRLLADLLSFVDAVPFGNLKDEDRLRPAPPTWSQLLERDRRP